MKEKDIIIFGKHSVLAKNFVESLDDSNNKIIELTRKKENKNDIVCDLGNEINEYEIKKITSKINYSSKFADKIFILFAWSGRPRTSIKEYKWQINDSIINNFLLICKKIKPSQIIFISTTSVYSEKESKIFKETDITQPISQYSKQKLIAENKINEFTKSFNIKSTILRVSSAYGYDKRFTTQGVVNKWIFDAIKYGNVELYNSLYSKINFISFSQISKAIFYSIEKQIFGIYNIGTLRSISLEYLLKKIKKFIKKEITIKLINNEERNVNIDINKFFFKTGIKFENELEDNIELLYYSIKKEIEKII